MSTIKNIVFDLGGVILDLDHSRAVRRFEEIGVENAAELLDPYEQKGIFLELETGKIDFPTFCHVLSRYAGKKLDEEAVKYAWMGFIVDVPADYKLAYIQELRKNYKVYLLSNTNPVILGWARSSDFTPEGRPITDYFDKIYASYEIGITKPDKRIFNYMIADNQLLPSETLFVDDGEKNITIGRLMGMLTYQPKNKEDWRDEVAKLLTN
ncbi:D-ribitol-5-phosphate phosphatase [Bacteroidia bacterium]|nr:D-ribitol-5-phosphate phosphatase [Bacteroidia bacterium]